MGMKKEIDTNEYRVKGTIDSNVCGSQIIVDQVSFRCELCI